MINPGERVMCLRKWQSSGLNPDSVKPNSVLSAIPLMTELGPLRPTDAPCLLGSRVRLSQKKSGQKEESQAVISHHGMRLWAPPTVMTELPLPLHSDSKKQHSLDACKSLQSLQCTHTRSPVRMAS